MEKYDITPRMNVMLYSTYTILYLNDMALLCFDDIRPFVKEEDKRTRTLFDALDKRVHSYFRLIKKIVGESIDKLADFNSEMDVFTQKPLDRYTEAIEKSYKLGGLVKYKYYSRVEVFRSLVCLAVAMSLHIVQCSKAIEPRSREKLEPYIIKDINEVAENFASWVYGRIKEEEDINMDNEKEVMDSFKELNEAVAEYKNFDTAYTKAFCRKADFVVRKKVMAIHNDGQKVVYESITDASKELGCSRSTITRHITSKTKYKGVELKALWI